MMCAPYRPEGVGCQELLDNLQVRLDALINEEQGLLA